jgi:hypothetical protein
LRHAAGTLQPAAFTADSCVPRLLTICILIGAFPARFELHIRLPDCESGDPDDIGVVASSRRLQRRNQLQETLVEGQ